MSESDDDTKTVDKATLNGLYGDELCVGAVAGEYSITETIGKGGCGVVYAGQHRLLGRRAAIKILKRNLAQSPQVVARFIREARTVNKIQHPNIIDIFSFGSLSDGRPFFVMEFLEGNDLERHFRTSGSMSPVEVLELLSPVLEALHAVHQAGVVHRDIKASNIFLKKVAAGIQPMLLDFGVAKMINPEPGEVGLTTAGTLVGTPSAMSPEQIRGVAVDARSDIYAVGVLLYRLVTGSFPFSSKDWCELEQMHLHASPPRPSQSAPVPKAFDDLVQKCLAKEPEQRFQSVQELLLALRQVSERGPESAQPTSLATGVAVYVDARAAAGADPDDEELQDEMGQLLYEAQQRFHIAGYSFPLQSSSSFLAARVLSPDGATARTERQETIQLAAELSTELAGSVPASLHFNLSVHVSAVILRDGEIVDGNLLRIAEWTPKESTTKVTATPPALAELALLPGVTPYAARV